MALWSAAARCRFLRPEARFRCSADPAAAGPALHSAPPPPVAEQALPASPSPATLPFRLATCPGDAQDFFARTSLLLGKGYVDMHPAKNP